jgi:RNA polymerase sigma factor (sigma-70 family)
MPIFRGRPDLLRDFRAGKRPALETVYRAYVDKVTGVIRFGFRPPAGTTRITGLKVDAAETSGLVQEVFLKAFAAPARASFDGLRDYGPFLYAIARNVLADWGRRLGRELPMLAEDLQRMGERADDAAWVPDEESNSWADPETVALTERYVEGLDDELKQVHRVRFVLGLSQRDAAGQLGIGRQTMRTLEGRLRAGLKRELEQRR